MNDIATTAYLAGLVDGEGYIGIKKMRPGRDRVSPGYHARLQVRMVDEEAIAFLAAHAGGKYYCEAGTTERRRALYCYQASDMAAEKVLRSLLPYLRVKRANAEAVISFREWQSLGAQHRTKLLGTRQFQGHRGGIRTVRTLGLSDEYVAACEAAYLECKRLNH